MRLFIGGHFLHVFVFSLYGKLFVAMQFSIRRADKQQPGRISRRSIRRVPLEVSEVYVQDGGRRGVRCH